MQHSLHIAALLGCALALLAPRVVHAGQGFWACGDVTLLSTEWTSDLGRDITVAGTVWAANPADNATRSQYPNPSWGARPERFITPLPFVALQRWCAPPAHPSAPRVSCFQVALQAGCAANKQQWTLPFLRRYPSGTVPGDLGFSVSVTGNGEELQLVDTHIDPWADEWPACDLDGEQVFIDWSWDPARDMAVQVDCGDEVHPTPPSSSGAVAVLRMQPPQTMLHAHCGSA